MRAAIGAANSDDIGADRFGGGGPRR